MRRRFTFIASVGAIVVALGAGALGADTIGTFATPATTIATAASSAGQASAQAALPTFAAAVSVISALVGGSNPSTVVAQSDHSTNAANDTNTSASNAPDEDSDADESSHGLSHGQQLGPSGTAGTRPGWGCGDKNHVHTGPPGGPTSTPPGCAKSH